jgi:hypothetical protein
MDASGRSSTTRLTSAKRIVNDRPVASPPISRRLARAGVLAAAFVLAGLVANAASPRPTATVVKQTSFKVNREGGAYPQAAFAGLSPEGGTVSVTQKFGATPSTATFTWVLPKEIPATGAKGSLTISVTVPADSERYAPAMAIDSAMLDCTGVKVGAGGSCSTGGRVQVGGVAEKGESKMFTQGFKLGGSAADVTVGIQDGPNITYSYASGQATAKPGACGTYKTRMLRSSRRTQAINELRVVCVEPDVAVHREGSADESWDPVEVGTILKQGDEISCDPDGIAVVAFADNSTFTLKHAAMLKIASFFTEGGVVRLEVLLRMGEVAATINKSEATKSDFRIKQPTATASVRGTIFSVFYDPVSKVSITSVKRGVVEVDPVKPGLKTVNVAAGKEVQVTPTAISPVAAAGKAGAIRGINSVKAHDLVMAKIAANNASCALVLPRTGAFSVKPAGSTWLVSVKATGGKAKGWSAWQVAGAKVTPNNALAKKIDAGCG